FFFLASQVLIVAGAITLEWTVKRRHEMAGFGALLALPSTPFSFGFTNFEFGLGVALFGIASWIACEHRKCQIRLGIHPLFVFALFVALAFALGIYWLVRGLSELRRMLGGRFDARGAVATVAMLAGPAVVPMAILYATGGTIGSPGNEWGFGWKPVWLALSF